MRSPPALRVDELADVRRAATLSDLRLDVSVAHTKSKLRARFCVSITRDHEKTNTRWSVGIDLRQLRHFDRELRRQVKHSNKQSHCATEGCVVCVELRDELNQWKRVSLVSTIGKRHLEDKCASIAQFLYRVFRLLSSRAAWFQTCGVLREVLRHTETLCHIQYADDPVAVRALAGLARLDHSRLPASDDTCCICMSAVRDLATSESTTPRLRIGVELPCGHGFHDTCISMWFHARLNCPVCRQDADPQAHRRMVVPQ